MDIILLRNALRGAIKLDIENAAKNLKLDEREHARCLKVCLLYTSDAADE